MDGLPRWADSKSRNSLVHLYVPTPSHSVPASISDIGESMKDPVIHHLCASSRSGLGQVLGKGMRTEQRVANLNRSIPGGNKERCRITPLCMPSQPSYQPEQGDWSNFPGSPIDSAFLHSFRDTQEPTCTPSVQTRGADISVSCIFYFPESTRAKNSGQHCTEAR